MGQKTIKLTITEDGETSLETSGFTGDACIKETADLESKLGVAGARTRKGEANAVAVGTQQKVGGR